MKISVKVDYACRVLTEIARLHGTGTLAQIEHLAKTEAVPPTFLAQILSELRNGGLITSRRGAQGGYALARPADQISLYDIVTVIDGDVLELSGNHAGRTGRRLRAVWQDIRTDLAEKMKSYTVDRLLAQNAAEMYYI
ncbi:Rrf2 family transcriptional regulator [Horticoccus luteus]|uniref:Rrf2 family transcriptional regulator n=1 Tax=Horticoccus luteus TaxID=2862869 RepID=A0A8F9XKG3_9BACT|nr:Rrf2 family transcriptional regulator [Horticoccus luteus]QYM78039.1 Rrf2 family transcriptional regulator [Horticoccus luteus]